MQFFMGHSLCFPKSMLKKITANMQISCLLLLDSYSDYMLNRQKKASYVEQKSMFVNVNSYFISHFSLKMNVKIFVFVILYLRSIYSISNMYSVKVKVMSQSRFEAPIDTHLIESLSNIQSLMTCSVLCERQSICRTADYNSTNKLCRLFETFTSMCTLLVDPTSSVLALNYCKNDEQTEPEFICTRSDTFTVQQIFDKLALVSAMSLSTSDRGAYANMYGVYTSSFN
jgi:hypothetical protein